MADDSGGEAQAPKTHPAVVRAKALAERGRVIAREAWIDFRRNSLYFQAKAGLVVAYIGIVLATLILAPPSPPTFGAVTGSVPWGVGKRTFIDLDNYDVGNLKDVIVEVHGTVIEFDGKESRGPWRMRLARLSEGDTVRVWPEKLLSDNNRPAGDNLDVSRVRIYPADDPSDILVDAAPTPKKD